MSATKVTLSQSMQPALIDTAQTLFGRSCDGINSCDHIPKATIRDVSEPITGFSSIKASSALTASVAVFCQCTAISRRVQQYCLTLVRIKQSYEVLGESIPASSRIPSAILRTARPGFDYPRSNKLEWYLQFGGHSPRVLASIVAEKSNAILRELLA